MIEAGTLIPVELVGGPCDGFRTRVEAKEQPFNVYLFEFTGGGRKFRLGYRWANRSTHKGRWWVLEFECVVSAQNVTEGTSSGGGEG